MQVIRAQDRDEQEVIGLLHHVPGCSLQPTDVAVALGYLADYMQQILDEPGRQSHFLTGGESSLVADLYAITVDDVVGPGGHYLGYRRIAAGTRVASLPQEPLPLAHRQGRLPSQFDRQTHRGMLLAKVVGELEA